METHDIIIMAVIAAIVLIQIAVFGNAMKKIRLFKRAIPSATSFQMVKMRIPENEITSLSVEELLTYDENNTVEVTEIITEEDETAFESLDPDTEIWISKGNEEQKILYKDLPLYQKSGWSE